MTVSRNHQHSDWEQQFERLSAYLDNEVDEAERAALERHLPTCEECRAALEELRQTRALLRALPAPALPRSFLIPETGAVPQPITRRAVAGTSSVRHVRGARVLQWAGGLVAAVGLFMLITSALPASTQFGSAATSNLGPSAGQGSASSSQQASSTAVVTERPVSTFPEGTEGNTHVPTQATKGIGEPTSNRPTSNQPRSTTSPVNSIPLGPIAGVLLLLVGAGLLLGGTLFLRRL
jgi:anti-sigma factor RsiW